MTDSKTPDEEEDLQRAAAESDSDPGAKTRIAGESESPDADEPRFDAETVLAEDDGRTEVVTRLATDTDFSVDADSEVDSNSGRGPETAVIAAAGTRVLDDKTKPPPVGDAQAADARPSPSPAAGASPATAPDPVADVQRGMTPGSVLFGEYEIVNVLGVGGMGEVYRARHRRLDEFRAIKVMHAELSKKKGASEFFYREAKALLAVRHPAVVHCHDLLSDESGHVYLIMEMIEGIPLSKKMNDGPLRPDEVAILGARVSHGLAAAHRQGVIHRDVSPDNIVLPNGNVRQAKIIDFGIAKLLEEGDGTILDGFKGKLSYASPEQLGFHGGRVDGRSDFYSLGLVLVAAAMGRPMAMGTTVVEAVDARRELTSLPDAIPVGLRSAIQPLLALDPNDRPEYVDRLFAVPGLESDMDENQSPRYATGGRASTGRSGTSGSKPDTLGARVGVVAAIAGAGLLLAGGAAYWTMGTSDGAELAAAGGATEVTGEAAPDSAREAAAGAAADASGEPLAAVPTDSIAEAPAPAPEKAPVRRLRASDRIKIIGLLSNAQLALDEGRLMTPSSDNAYDRYRRVLDLDPTNKKAQRGLRSVADRYLSLANRAIDSGDMQKANEYLSRARRADASAPNLATTQARLR